MYNFDHEIEMPQDKAIKKFLFSDYFHDSDIEDITFNNDKKKLLISLCSCQDIDLGWEKLKGTDDEKRQYVTNNKEKYIYYLCFEKVAYFTLQSDNTWTQYINGRFKDSARLKIIQSHNPSAIYHFRIQLADGFMDIIFKSFKIRKYVGNVNYDFTDETRWSTDDGLESEALISLEQHILTAKNGDEFDKFFAMVVLNKMKYAGLLEIARDNFILDSEYMEAAIYAAYLLGKIGSQEDITKLYDFHTYMNKLSVQKKGRKYMRNCLIERIVLDAIEMLNLNKK